MKAKWRKEFDTKMNNRKSTNYDWQTTCSGVFKNNIYDYVRRYDWGHDITVANLGLADVPSSSLIPSQKLKVLKVRSIIDAVDNVFLDILVKHPDRESIQQRDVSDQELFCNRAVFLLACCRLVFQ